MAARKETTERRSAERRAPPRAAASKTARSPVLDNDARTEVSPEELRKLISEAAYYRAKQRGFVPGHEVEDWIQAEAEVIARLNSGRPNSGRPNSPGGTAQR
jgi:hypothetical protein